MNNKLKHVINFTIPYWRYKLYAAKEVLGDNFVNPALYITAVIATYVYTALSCIISAIEVGKTLQNNTMFDIAQNLTTFITLVVSITSVIVSIVIAYILLNILSDIRCYKGGLIFLCVDIVFAIVSLDIFAILFSVVCALPMLSAWNSMKRLKNTGYVEAFERYKRDRREYTAKVK